METGRERDEEQKQPAKPAAAGADLEDRVAGRADAGEEVSDELSL
jgi:hypothetical protein